jgi:phospholipase A-2-activating protein
VSASHDCSLRVWSGTGEVLSELLGHTAIIYSVAATAEGRIASGEACCSVSCDHKCAVCNIM